MQGGHITNPDYSGSASKEDNGGGVSATNSDNYSHVLSGTLSKLFSIRASVSTSIKWR